MLAPRKGWVLAILPVLASLRAGPGGSAPAPDGAPLHCAARRSLLEVSGRRASSTPPVPGGCSVLASGAGRTKGWGWRQGCIGTAVQLTPAVPGDDRAVRVWAAAPTLSPAGMRHARQVRPGRGGRDGDNPADPVVNWHERATIATAGEGARPETAAVATAAPRRTPGGLGGGAPPIGRHKATDRRGSRGSAAPPAHTRCAASLVWVQRYTYRFALTGLVVPQLEREALTGGSR